MYLAQAGKSQKITQAILLVLYKVPADTYITYLFNNWKLCCKVQQRLAKPSFRNGLIGSIPIASANKEIKMKKFVVSITLAVLALTSNATTVAARAAAPAAHAAPTAKPVAKPVTKTTEVVKAPVVTAPAARPAVSASKPASR